MTDDSTDNRSRRDDEPDELDIEAAITDGVLAAGRTRDDRYSATAVAASLRLEELHVPAYAVKYLADCVRAMGLSEAAALPEPLLGADPTRLARAWLLAASGPKRDIVRDDFVARWLELISILIAVRTNNRETGDVPTGTARTTSATRAAAI